MRACVVMETKQLRIHHHRVIIKTNLGIDSASKFHFKGFSGARPSTAVAQLALAGRPANQTEK